MALVKCKECGSAVSKKAESCPKCGNPIKKPKQKTGCASYVVLGFIILMAYSYYKVDQLPMPSNSTPTSNNSTSSPKPKAPSYALELLSFSCDKEHGYVHVRGEVKNISGKKLDGVMAVGEFRTADGALVKSEDALIDYNPIMPNQTSPFEALGTDNPQITNCQVGFKFIFGGAIPYKKS